MTIHLDPQQLDLVKSILVQNGISGDVYAFGSRVRGDYRPYSDLDLVIKKERPLESSKLVTLKSALADSDLPITVDIVEWSLIPADFQERIRAELVKIL